jgi:gliding motility-associated-like protein
VIKISYIVIILSLTFAKLKAQNLLVNFSKTERACELARASVNVISGATPVHFEWSNGSISNNVDQLEPGDYSVYVKADNNKDTTIYFRIETVICEPYPDDHFTPNGDDFNDTWSIGRLENFPEFELFVYNRWGQLVHHQVNVYMPWDGRSLGLPLPDATYYYILYLEKSNKKNFIKGGISIIR